MNTAILGINRRTVLLLLRLLERHGPVNQIQVKVVSLQIREGLLDSFDNVGGLVVRVPELGSQEDLAARHARGFDAGADFLFVVVSCCSVDVAVAALESALDRLGDLIGLGLLIWSVATLTIE